MTPLYVDIGKQVALLRKARRWRQHDLASRMGWSRGAIAHLERGRRNLYLHDALALASVFGLTLEDLLRSVEP